MKDLELAKIKMSLTKKTISNFFSLRHLIWIQIKMKQNEQPSYIPPCITYNCFRFIHNSLTAPLGAIAPNADFLMKFVIFKANLTRPR